MGITQKVSRLFTRKAMTNQLGNSLGVVMRNYGKAPQFQPEKQVTGITYKAIDKIGLSLSVYEPIVKRPGGEPYASHPIYSLFNKPNSVQTNPSDFVHLYGMLMEIYGETFWYKAKGELSGKVKEVYLLPPDRMEVKVYDNELIGYILHKTNGQQIPFLPDEILHDKRPNPFNEWRGMSVLEKSAVYVNTEIVTSTFTMNYISNSASPSGIVSLPDMDKAAFQSFASQWREGYEGPQNAGKTAFIRGSEAKFQAVGSTLKDIDQKVTREMAKEDVLMMLEVPKALLGQAEDKGLGRANVEALWYIYAREKLEPIMRRLDRIYETLALELSKGQPVDVTHKSPVPEDKEFELNTLKAGVNVWLTVNEAREKYGLQPLPNGDVLQPKNTVTETPKKIKLKTAAVEKPQRVYKAQADEQEAFRSKLIATNEKYATQMKRALVKIVTSQETNVIERINASSKSYEEWLFSVKEQSELTATALLPIMLELMDVQAEDTVNFITGELITIPPELRQTVEQNIKQIAGVFNADTITALEQTLSEGQTAGESLAKLKKRVETVFDDAKGYRAERIARTESLRASNMSAEEVYKQNGYSSVEWFINPGACEFCRTYAGKTKAIGGTFTKQGDVVTGADGGQMRIEYADISYPPLHPQCSCSIIPSD